MTETTTPSSVAPSTPVGRKKKSLRRRLLRLVLWTFAILAITAGVTLWIATRSWFIISQVQPELQRRLGGPVHIADAAYVGNGRFVFRGVVIHAPGYNGPAGRVGQIDRVELQLDPSRMLDGSKAVQKLILDGVHLRLSEEANQPGRFSFMALQPDWSSDPDDDYATVLPPSIEIHNLHVELGVHDGDDYTRIGLRRLAGEMHPSATDETWYAFELGEVDDNGVGIGEQGLRVKGEWNVATNEHKSRLDGLQLDERTYAMCPQIVRDWWDRMELEGRVDGVKLNWKRDMPLTVELDIADVALTIPVETKNIWARYRGGRVDDTPSRPRMRVSEGAIRLEGDHFTLDGLKGELGAENESDDVVGVPYAIHLDIPELPKLQWQQRTEWLDEALKRAAFTMEFSMDGFQLTTDDVRKQPAVDLPKVVAEALERFEMQDWVLDTQVTITRAPPIEGEDGVLIAQPEQWTGKAYIKHASCRYENFPYPLTEVDAFLEFDRDSVKLVYLYGFGSQNTRIHLTGEISPLTSDAAVHLKLTAEGMPIDDQLRDALGPGQRSVFDALINMQAFQGLEAAGLITDEDDIELMRQQREHIVRELTQLRPRDGDQILLAESDESVATIEKLRNDMARLDRLIQAGPFQLGGRVDIDLNIDREFGAGKKAYVTGEMTIRDGGLLYERFPYPLNITGGKIEWTRDRIIVREDDDTPGLTFITPGGGIGRITGEVRFPSETESVEPQLTVEVLNDSINESILAAIPPGEQQLQVWQAAQEQTAASLPVWPGKNQSRVASVMSELGLHGDLNYRGHIDVDDQQRVNFSFAVAIANARAKPGNEASNLFGESGLFWPQEFDIYDIEAMMRISRDSLELVELNGRHSKQGMIAATGYMNLASKPSNTHFIVDLLDLPIDEYLLDIAPREGVTRARELWAQYQPAGLFDATLVYNATGDQPGKPELRLRPKQVHATINDQTVTLKRSDGEMWLRESTVQFEDLRLTLSANDQPNGELILNGTYGVLERDKDLQLLGRWADGQLDSPIITEAMLLLGAQNEAAEFAALQPHGIFDATFRYRSPQAEQPGDFELALQPRSVSFKRGDVTIKAVIDDGGTILVQPGLISAEDLSGTLGDGRFIVTGNVQQHDGETDIDLSMNFDGRLSCPEVLALLPDTARRALLNIKFNDGPGTTLRDGRLRLKQRLSTNNEKPAQWETTFRAHVRTDNASFVGGLNFEQINALFDIALRTEPGQPPRLSILTSADTVRVLGNTMTSATAEIRLEPADRISVRAFQANLHGGVVTAEAQFSIGENRDYHTTVSMAGVAIDGLLASDENETPDGLYEPAPDQQRSGDVFGRLALQGELGQPQRQTGRGSVRIAQGPIAKMPILFSVLHVMELMPPLSDTLNYGDIEFFIEGDQATLNQIFFECPTLQLRGQGVMNLTTMDINVLFRSRNTMAIVGDMIGGVSDQLFGIRVSGPLTDPSASLVPLPGLTTENPDQTEPMPDTTAQQVSAVVD